MLQNSNKEKHLAAQLSCHVVNICGPSFLTIPLSQPSLFVTVRKWNFNLRSVGQNVDWYLAWLCLLWLFTHCAGWTMMLNMWPFDKFEWNVINLPQFGTSVDIWRTWEIHWAKHWWWRQLQWRQNEGVATMSSSHSESWILWPVPNPHLDTGGLCQVNDRMACQKPFSLYH